MYKLEFYVPLDQTKSVLEAIFRVGAGRIGQYEHCCFITKGQGQFKAMEGAHPSIGEVGKLEVVEENKVELVLHDELANNVREALIDAHPYETPAYQFFKIDDIF